jgi:phage FluMu protein Com
MKSAVEMKIHGIKCDDCDFVDEQVNVEGYESYLNKPCPKCGANLLTEADFNNVKALMAIFNAANNIFPEREEDEEIVKMSVEMNGTGDMNFNLKK